MQPIHAIVPAALLALFVGTPACADVLKYELVGATTAATFFLDTARAADNVNQNGQIGNFGYYGVQGTLLSQGSMVPATFSVQFFNAFQYGGLDLYSTVRDPNSSDGTGWEFDDRFFASTDLVSDPQEALFTGSVSSPTFRTGTFVLKDWFNFDDSPLLTYRLTVTAVPEPASWALMASGVGALALFSRRRSSKARHEPLAA